MGNNNSLLPFFLCVLPFGEHKRLLLMKHCARCPLNDGRLETFFVVVCGGMGHEVARRETAASSLFLRGMRSSTREKPAEECVNRCAKK